MNNCFMCKNNLEPPRGKIILLLKVGSCPKDDISVEIFNVSFLCSICINIFSEPVAAKKNARFCSKFACFRLFISFVFEFRF